MSLTTRLLGAALAGLLLTSAATVPASAARTKEESRVDRVQTPKLGWYKCYAWAQCATAHVPLDYDHPHGAQATIALLRVKATDQKHKIGTLFVNPGGPGAPATTFAMLAPLFLSDTVLARFDVVGIDPRGIGSSTNINCFGTARNQTIALKGMQVPFPYGAKEEKAYIASAKKMGQACGRSSLAGAMSSAEAARDMEVMRRAVGDKKLNYLGFSYGTVIGQYYANMFPDRFRTIAVDGVINPRSWVGSKSTANQIQDERLRSADGAYQAFVEIMRRCDKAGSTKCAFADGNPLNNFATITQRLKKKPIVISIPGLITIKETYATFIAEVLDALYGETAGDDVTALAAAMQVLTSPGGSVTAAQVKAAQASYGRLKTRGFPYDNSFEAYAAVSCTDGRHPKDASSWPAAAAKADKRAPYFGRAWAWATVQCASKTWTAQDEDAYRGPFTQRTANTMLFVGSRWDPATNYRDAVTAAELAPNSRLLSSDNWGHTAYGTSNCATGAIDNYLIHKRLPAVGTLCRGDAQPFTAAPTDITLLGTAKEKPPVDQLPLTR
jgi:pimeloyl-ACP methyl ester carboxylesterase